MLPGDKTEAGHAPSRPVRKPGARTRITDFWREITEGMRLQQLWTQFAAEAREGYGLYSKEVDWDAIQRASRWRRPFRVARALFLIMLMKLSPARRVLFLLALVLLVLSGIGFRVGGESGAVEVHPGHLAAAGAVLLILLLALELADRVTMKRDLEIAREIQHWLVPEKPPAIPGAEIAFVTRPANTVAGDYYDAFLRPASPQTGGPGRWLVVVADVAGKSVPAALLMATFQASLHTLAAVPTSLEELVAGLNRYACAHSLDGRRFTTALLAELDPDSRTLRYVSAGHNAPVLCRASGNFERLVEGGMPLGIDSAAVYASGAVTLALGDLLVVFTDGVVEAVTAGDEEFGERRLLDLLGTIRAAHAEEALSAIMAGVEAFAHGTRQHDDITCVVLRAI